MKARLFLKGAILMAGLFFFSCEEDIPQPVVTLNELGYENSKISYAGGDLHIEANIVAEGKIDYVTVEIHAEEHETGEEGDHEEWEMDTTYTEFSGLKNTTFHKHLEVAVDADTGHYHFHFIVTDMEGQQTTVEAELEIQYPSDAIAPTISVSSAPTSGQAFANGETITISGSVSDEAALGGMYIGLVRADQSLTDAEVNASNTITLLHTHDFDSYTAHNFTASINVGTAKDNDIEPKDITGDIVWQSGNYYILVKCKDAFGGNWTFSSQYPIVINN